MKQECFLRMSAIAVLRFFLFGINQTKIYQYKSLYRIRHDLLTIDIKGTPN